LAYLVVWVYFVVLSWRFLVLFIFLSGRVAVKAATRNGLHCVRWAFNYAHSLFPPIVVSQSAVVPVCTAWRCELFRARTI